MDQINELFSILKSTPQLAVWGLLIWCLYILMKLASVVYALKAVIQLGINRWHDIKVKTLSLEDVDKMAKQERLLQKEKEELLEVRKGILSERSKNELNKTRLKELEKLAKRFDRESISSEVYLDDFSNLIDAIKGDGMYIHRSHIKEAIKKLTE